MWQAIIPLAIAAYQAYTSKKSADKSEDMVSNLQYQPIDLKQLQEQARTTAEENARKSIELEKELNPDLSTARFDSQKMVADDLKDGGQLPTDVANAVTSGGIAQSNKAGLYGGGGPITAANLGLTALGLRDQRLTRALTLAQANPTPTAGLDPGAVASLEVAQNNALNQFNLAKSGALNKANQSKSDATSSLIGAAGSVASAYFGGKK
jgi:hypothetical protein